VTRCTIKEVFSNKHRKRVSRSVNKLIVKPSGPEKLLSQPPIELSLKRGPYFKKYRHARGLLSLLRRISLPMDFNRRNRRILRGAYYCIPVLQRLLFYLPDQISLVEMENTLFCWLLLANITRGSVSTINRWRMPTFDEISTSDVSSDLGKALMSPASGIDHPPLL
jgi:hypothetical protein